MERRIGQTEALREERLKGARLARDLATLRMAEIDEALIEYQIDSVGIDAGIAIMGQEEARMEAYWHGRSLPPMDIL